VSLVRTRIAPSPTGFLHLGTARTALYSWAYARHHGGQFVLRIEDTDVARSTQESVDQILAAMRWLDIDVDEGPIHQMQRLARYREVIDRMLSDGSAYRCWSTPDELESTREAQRARGEKPRYDGRWRPEPGKALPTPPPGVQPVIRFRNPVDGDVSWDDLVKGRITIANREIDDLIISRPAPPDAHAELPEATRLDAMAHGVPTYNFAVVVDDMDMRITHVFRGDEHINNTPWQINIFRALGSEPPHYGHCPIILGEDGLKLSKRRGAVSVMAYEEAGYLPEALLNYLARLGWSHGDEEVFTRDELVQWFDGTHLSKSPAQWDPAKLAWVNAQWMKQTTDVRLAALVGKQLVRRGIVKDASHVPEGAWLERACALFKDRCTTTVEIADWVVPYLGDLAPTAAIELEAHRSEATRVAVADLEKRLRALPTWDAASIAAAMKATLAACSMKMPQLAVPVRLATMGRAQTPSIDAVLALFDRDRERALQRLANAF
jgi:glutamyl-tRNA synthetase